MKSMSLNHRPQSEAGHERVCASYSILNRWILMISRLFMRREGAKSSWRGRLAAERFFKCVITLSQLPSTCWAPIPIFISPPLTQTHTYSQTRKQFLTFSWTYAICTLFTLLCVRELNVCNLSDSCTTNLISLSFTCLLPRRHPWCHVLCSLTCDLSYILYLSLQIAWNVSASSN